MKNLTYCLIGIILAGAAIPTAEKLAAQSSNQTRIYIPWVSGSDAGYAFLLQVNNASMDAYGTTAAAGTCNADVYYNGKDYSGSLGSFPAGQVTVVSEGTIASATGVPLANSGQRGYMFLTCNFKYAHANGILVNPGGSLAFINGYVVPANRTAGTGPEQLLQ